MQEIETHREEVISSEPTVLNSKQWLIATLSEKIFNDEELLNRALSFCAKKGNEGVSLEEYVMKRIKTLLPLFPEVQKEYSVKLGFERKLNVESAKAKRAQRRKLRRKSR